MKRIFFFVALFLLQLSLFSQSPQRLNYQAVVRDNAGVAVASQLVSLRMTILEGSTSGNAVYIETHSVTTNQLGLVTLPVGGGNVVTGTFSTIDWASNTHFMQIEIDLSGASNYALMGTSQLLSVPYALHANTVSNDQVDDADADPANELQTLSKNGATISLSNNGGSVTDEVDDADADPANELQSLSLNGLDLSLSNGNTVTLPSGGGNTLDEAYDEGGPGIGRVITADAGAVQITTATPNSIALDVDQASTGVAIAAENSNPATAFSAIQGITNSNSTAASAVVGNSDGAAWGVSGQISATATAQAGVYGSNLRTNGGHGVRGVGFNGVVGETNQRGGFAVFGENFDVNGTGNGVGVAGTGYWGVVGEDRYLGTLVGAYGVFSNGTLGASGTKTFQIDHPLDPENKFLRHFSVESNEVLNLYRGTATFDAQGRAVVELPDYFEAINHRVTYQLTPVGAYMPLFIAEKVKDGMFVIGGGMAGKEVSWTVTAERNDPYLQAYPDQKQVELAKRPGQQGRYLMPELYGGERSTGLLTSPGSTYSQPVLEIRSTESPRQ